MGTIGQAAGGALDPNASGIERTNAAADRRRAPEGGDSTPGARDFRPAIIVGETTGGDLNILLALLVALMLACGVAAGITVNLAPAYADDGGDGY